MSGGSSVLIEMDKFLDQNKTKNLLINYHSLVSKLESLVRSKIQNLKHNNDIDLCIRLIMHPTEN